MHRKTEHFYASGQNCEASVDFLTSFCLNKDVESRRPSPPSVASLPPDITNTAKTASVIILSNYTLAGLCVCPRLRLRACGLVTCRCTLRLLIVKKSLGGTSRDGIREPSPPAGLQLTAPLTTVTLSHDACAGHRPRASVLCMN